MSEDPYLELQDLIEKTEANVKRLERYSRTYVSPVINEYRYALFHLVHARNEGRNSLEELRKAVNHMRRAYCDSCEILLDWLVCSGREYMSAVRENAAISKVCGVEPEAYAKVLSEATILCHWKDGIVGQNRDCARVQDIQNAIDRLSEYQNSIRDCRFSLKAERIRFKRERFFVWMSYLLAIISMILSVAVSVVSLKGW